MPDSTLPPAQPSPQALAEKKAREEKWLEENRAAFAYWNERMEREGLLLAEYRQL